MYIPLSLLVFIISFWCFYLRKRNHYRLPSGPPGLPFIGHMHKLVGKNPYEVLSKWADQFGKIYTINLCGAKAVVINEPKLMRDILGTFASTGKFQTDVALLISKGQYGVLNSDGDVWSGQRRFCVQKLKEFGFGNKRMETLILSEANEVCNWITKANKENNGTALVMQPIFLQSVVNTIWTMVTGTRITLGDSKIALLMETWTTTLQHTMKTGLLFVPWLKYLSPKLSGYTAHEKSSTDVWNHIEKEFIDHKKTFIAGAQRDLIDAYIEESGSDPIKWKHALGTVVELFLAGSETTGSTLTFLLYYMSVNPDIQKKLQEEIDKIVGESEEISLDHKSRMPYTESVILEIMRMCPIAAFGSPHIVLDDLEIDSFKFPKGLILLANIYHCHYNKDVWTDPEVYRPQRFLDEYGGKLKDNVIPFQQGKRQCVGEPLVKDILFIFVARIFQLFNVYPDKNVKPEDYYKIDIGPLLLPPSLGVVFKPRRK